MLNIWISLRSSVVFFQIRERIKLPFLNVEEKLPNRKSSNCGWLTSTDVINMNILINWFPHIVPYNGISLANICKRMCRGNAELVEVASFSDTWPRCRGVSGVVDRGLSCQLLDFLYNNMNIKRALLHTGYIIRWETDVASFACTSRRRTIHGCWLSTAECGVRSSRNDHSSRIYYTVIKLSLIVYKVLWILKKKSIISIWNVFKFIIILFKH